MQVTPLRRIEFPLPSPEKLQGQGGKTSRRHGALGTVAGLQGLVPHPALGVVTHLGFQFCDLQVQFIQVFVHESDERLEENTSQALRWRLLPRRLPRDSTVRTEDEAQPRRLSQ